ncbi:MAG TPA: WXG100 family type VII secretion target [Ktedonobacteraceae bacterium]|nr:WXG100 family type VII secretion target [Ktedonobacteraceae bacterium]
MATIHINTDLLRQLGQMFVQLNDQIQNQLEPQIQNVTNQLENDWQGQSRYRYDQMYNDWRTTTTRIIQTGEDLGRHLQNTAQQFEQADNSLS